MKVYFDKKPEWDAKLNKLSEICKKLNCTLAQLAIAWVIVNPDVSTSIMGATKISQLEEDIKALSLYKKLDKNILLEIEKILMNTPQGEVLFRKNGLSGIVIFNTASIIARGNKKATKIVLDLLPEYSQTEIENYCKLHTYNGFLQGFFNPKMIQYLLKRFPNEKDLIKHVKHLEFTFKDFAGFDFSQVSVGGIEVDQVNETLESKVENGVYILGELLDVDGPCGGYNLTFAFASALKATK